MQINIKGSKEKPFSSACERNKEPILQKLKLYLGDRQTRVFEVGSGTGQHALFFTQEMANLIWTPSDIKQRLEGIQAWISSAPRSQMMPPVEFELGKHTDIGGSFDMLYSANVLHIVSEPRGQDLLDLVARQLPGLGAAVFYGPFKYGGQFTSQSNAKFDQSLKVHSSESGIRDFEWVDSELAQRGFRLKHDFSMPANNRLLIFVPNN
jgi:cyclopropane fatty-acyl-phospholipid synthase-like methyltransferase